MNNRIRELHIQAQQEAFSEPIDIENCAVEDIKGFSQQVYEKFAELIVQECLEQVFYTIEDEEQDNISGSIRDRITQHFGVEE